MDNREAQFVLNAYRPGGQDAVDPQFSEALAQARRDPSLQRWFNESIAFDRAVTQKLCAVEVPAGLRESILAGGKVSRRSRWSKPFVRWAIAAALVVTAITGSLMLRESTRPHLARWQTEALRQISEIVNGKSKFDFQSRTPPEVVTWLQTHRAPTAEKLPQNLEKLESLGCKTFFWNGQPVSVICFVRWDGGLIHLVATNASGSSDRVRKSEPQLAQRGDWATATWREGDKVYMLALEGPRDQLQSYLL